VGGVCVLNHLPAWPMVLPLMGASAVPRCHHPSAFMRSAAANRYGLAEVARHVIDKHVEPSLLESNGNL